MTSWPSSSGSTGIIDIIRRTLGDPKTREVHEINDPMGRASGESQETFFTTYSPISSNSPVNLRMEGTVGYPANKKRMWVYTYCATESACNGIRGYVWSETSGAFRIPSNAIMPASGDVAYGTYNWDEEQNYIFTDDEIGLFIRDAVPIIEGKYPKGYSASGVGADMAISPSPTRFSETLFVLQTIYLMKFRLLEEGFSDRMYIREIDLTVDTTKGIRETRQSLDTLNDYIDALIKKAKVTGQESAFARIDTYSTLHREDQAYGPSTKFGGYHELNSQGGGRWWKNQT